MSKTTAYRGSLFYFKDSVSLETVPRKKVEPGPDQQFVYIEDGVLIVADGIITAAGSYQEHKDQLSGITVVDYSKKLLTPGFIDTHQHATQSPIVAAYGEKLLEWLQSYVFPGEAIFKDPEVARRELRFFIDQLVRNGTTTAVSYGPTFYPAADILFEELSRRNMRFITGNMLMDTNADALLQSTQENYDSAKKLLQKWHNHKRLSYCISPRFALSCTEQLLELCGALKKEHPDVYVQTHLDENVAEVADTKKAFPWSKNYLDVYHRFGLVTNKTVFGHCIHLSDDELRVLKETQAIVSWCPISNNFLGSGLFNFAKVAGYTDKITLGTDWGAGNHLSMFSVLDDAYKVAMLQSYKLPSMVRWYLCTLGAAKALQIDDKVGSFKPGKEADFIVIDPESTSMVRYREQEVDNIFDLLFILMTLGSEQNIMATYIYGEEAYIRV